ncbi:MAG: NUDIX hydrolase [Ignavibacteria bacterium]|nr:NUDIX hydrolase [Ignavibacteria bacterium]
MKFSLLSSETIYKGRVFDIRVDKIAYESGNEAWREVALHNGGAVIVPVTPEGKFVLIRQYRYPLSEWLLEFPAGKLEKDEDPFLCAGRELQEETGYTADSIVPLGSIFTTPGFCTERLFIYAALGLKPGEHAREEGEQGMEVIELSAEEINEYIRSGKLMDSKSLSAYVMYQAYEGRK